MSDANPESRTTAEVARLRGVLATVLATMQALHPSAAGDMSDGGYAGLWNATMEMLEKEMSDA